MATYEKKYTTLLIQLMGSGLSFEASCAEIGLSPKVVRSWENHYPEFSDARDFGYWKHLAFYERLLIALATGVMPDALRERGSNGICLPAVQFVLFRRHPQLYDSRELKLSSAAEYEDARTIEEIENELSDLLSKYEMSRSHAELKFRSREV